MAPLVVGVFAVVGHALVGPLDALVFGALLIQTGAHPRAMLCWVIVTSVLGAVIVKTN